MPPPAPHRLPTLTTLLTAASRHPPCRTLRPRPAPSSPSPRRLTTPASKIGQPTPDTHPHLLKPGEVTRGIQGTEYAARRARLVSGLPDGSVVVVAGYGLRYATQGIFYPFHQNTDLFYLCGVNEPDCALVLEKTTGAGYKMILFVKPTDAHRVVWDGPRAGLEGAVGFFGATEARSIDTFQSYLTTLTSPTATRPVYTDLPLHGPAESILNNTAKPDPSTTSYAFPPRASTPHPKPNIHPLAPHLTPHRLLKSRAETALLTTASTITSSAFKAMMRETPLPNTAESDLWALAEYTARRAGASGLAYVPVVAGGVNSLTIHYVVNDQRLRQGDLVLVDAGAEYASYCADVTRTWPTSGVFTAPQRQLYEAVLRVQKQCVAKCTVESRTSLDAIQRECWDALRVEVQKVLGRAVGVREMNTLYPHHVGHYLGLDVHDTFSVSRSTPLQAGMVLTIEPGLYIPDTAAYPPGLRGVGVRIEDDVLVGGREEGWAAVVLSGGAPKEVRDVEDCVRGVL
ncbi:peptidase M24, structural domain-containing protein [Fimicolochytrium jonesii]|uniref:peptidase M24, structural domain-containing protein n=1 Tax=Fimicolochytrium jonesii TaxID=1396493 RepID=UPI0022FDF998|nr:peptidase M24, structural domain-containing protein [Fimicolochytrium jonesii]KAI8822263.1 peptidase M24, structural domain-containing protein [Fimicolochytrium jonesii]